MNTTVTLSKRESEIAELIAWGATKKEVANQLFRSPRTIEATVRNIYSKTGVTKANELSAWYFCTHFNISFELSPLKRSLVASIFLTLICTSEFLGHANTLRNRAPRSRRAERIEETRVRSRRTEDFEYITDFEL